MTLLVIRDTGSGGRRWRSGLAAVRAERPDLVITDVLMPVMDGYEFVRQMRLDPATSGIPVVFQPPTMASVKRGRWPQPAACLMS